MGRVEADIKGRDLARPGHCLRSATLPCADPLPPPCRHDTRVYETLVQEYCDCSKENRFLGDSMIGARLCSLGDVLAIPQRGAAWRGAFVLYLRPLSTSLPHTLPQTLRRHCLPGPAQDRAGVHDRQRGPRPPLCVPQL